MADKEPAADAAATPAEAPAEAPAETGLTVLGNRSNGQPWQALTALSEDTYVGPPLMTNVDVSNLEGRQLIQQASKPSRVRDDVLNGEVFAVKYWIVEAGQLPDKETGEPVHVAHLTLIDPDGRMLKFCSRAVLRAFDRIRMFHGDGPYDPPIGVAAEHVITANGNRTYALYEVALPVPAKGKKS